MLQGPVNTGVTSISHKIAIVLEKLEPWERKINLDKFEKLFCVLTTTVH